MFIQKTHDFDARGDYFSTRPSTAGIIRKRVLFKGGSYLRKYGKCFLVFFLRNSISFHLIINLECALHYSYLDIYISQKIRLCKGGFEPSTYRPNPSLFWARNVVYIVELWFDAKNAIQICQLFWILVKMCKKQWIWQILKKNRRKISTIDLNFQPRKVMDLACWLNRNLPSKSLLHNLIFCEM